MHIHNPKMQHWYCNKFKKFLTSSNKARLFNRKSPLGGAGGIFFPGNSFLSYIDNMWSNSQQISVIKTSTDISYVWYLSTSTCRSYSVLVKPFINKALILLSLMTNVVFSSELIHTWKKLYFLVEDSLTLI